MFTLSFFLLSKLGFIFLLLVSPTLGLVVAAAIFGLVWVFFTNEGEKDLGPIGKVFCWIVGVICALGFVASIGLSVEMTGVQASLMQPWGEYVKEKDRKEAESSAVRVNHPAELRRYILVSWNPPKHFYVTLKDVATGQLIEGLHVSKHCNSAGSLKAGEVYNLRVQPYTMSNKPSLIHYEFANLYQEFCS